MTDYSIDYAKQISSLERQAERISAEEEEWKSRHFYSRTAGEGSWARENAADAKKRLNDVLSRIKELKAKSKSASLTAAYQVISQAITVLAARPDKDWFDEWLREDRTVGTEYLTFTKNNLLVMTMPHDMWTGFFLKRLDKRGKGGTEESMLPSELHRSLAKFDRKFRQNNDPPPHDMLEGRFDIEGERNFKIALHRVLGLPDNVSP